MLSLQNIVADIGGTNARFAVLNNGEFVQQRVLPCADYATINDAISAYCAMEQVRVENLAMAIANPVLGDAIKMTNHHWSFSINAVKNDLQLNQLHVINDFEALAMALPFFADSDLRQCGGKSPVLTQRNVRAVIGPGTGLGVASSVQFISFIAGQNRSQFIALPAEGGHVSYAPRNAREWSVLNAVSAQFSNHVSAERLISGPGLVLWYTSLCQLDKQSPANYDAATIVQQALNEQDRHCVEALDLFCAALGNVAGNLALTLGARAGVYIGGGIVPKLGDYFYRSRFRHSFEDKGRFNAYLADIPVYVIQAEFPAFIGVAQCLRSAE